MKRNGHILCVLCFMFLCLGYFLYVTWIKIHIIPKLNMFPNCIYGFNKEVKDNMWQPIGNTEEMVFSAYADRGNSSIKVIGLATRKRNKENRYWCLLHYFCSVDEGHKISVVEARVQIIPEHHSQRLSAAFFICNMKSLNFPEAVSILNNKIAKPRNIISVQDRNALVRNFTVCVSPFNENYDNDHSLVEMIELNKILGANHFVFYNFSIGLKVDRILKFYQKKGEIDVIRWNLDHNITNQIHYYGQMASINDCLYRTKGRSKFMVNQDLDEFIIPRQHKTWNEMMASFPQNKSSYLFRSSLFRTDWDVGNRTFNGMGIAKKLKSVTLLKQSRETFIFPKNVRSKYIAVSNKVDIAGIHFIWTQKQSFTTYNVNPNVTLLHHYRYWPKRCNETEQYDDKIMKYKDSLLTKLVKTWEEIRNMQHK